MPHGLEGRRIALAALHDDPEGQPRIDVVRRVLEQAGARLDVLKPGQGSEEDWHGGRYAALIAIGGDGRTASDTDPRLEQLVREFLVSEKPVAAIGDAVLLIVRAGGAAGRTLAADDLVSADLEAAGGNTTDQPIHADGCLISAKGTADSEAFAAQVVRAFAGSLEERETDEMSEQSFPASDPPATTPASTGHVSPEKEPEARP